MSMADKIKERRLALGFTQEELAEKIGLQKSAIAKYENGRVQNIKRSIIQKLANVLECAPSYLLDYDADAESLEIPVYGSVSAGFGAVAEGNIESFIKVPNDLPRHGEYFGLRIKGNSMEPDIQDGDVVIVRKQDTIPESGAIVVAIVNGDEGFCKRLALYPGGISLVSNNPAYLPLYYSAADIDALPVKIVGVVVRLIRMF